MEVHTRGKRVRGAELLTNNCDGECKGQKPPGTTAEEATSPKDTWGEAQQLLEAELKTMHAAAFGESQVLEDVILPKRINWHQVSPGERSGERSGQDTKTGQPRNQSSSSWKHGGGHWFIHVTQPAGSAEL